MLNIKYIYFNSFIDIRKINESAVIKIICFNHLNRHKTAETIQ